MIKQIVEYETFDGEIVKDELYFHFSNNELVSMEYSVEDGLTKRLEDMIDAEDDRAILESFKNIILDAYGVKSEDGKRFIKNEEIRKDFEQSIAFDEIFMLLTQDTQAMLRFVKGLVPAKTAKNLPKDFDEQVLARAQVRIDAKEELANEE